MSLIAGFQYFGINHLFHSVGKYFQFFINLATELDNIKVLSEYLDIKRSVYLCNQSQVFYWGCRYNETVVMLGLYSLSKKKAFFSKYIQPWEWFNYLEEILQPWSLFSPSLFYDKISGGGGSSRVVFFTLLLPMSWSGLYYCNVLCMGVVP